MEGIGVLFILAGIVLIVGTYTETTGQIATVILGGGK